jgi:NADH:ubiquinone oxidoreductase subunit 6 (subunit J)
MPALMILCGWLLSEAAGFGASRAKIVRAVLVLMIVGLPAQA